jgi:hypothetical protein
VVAGDRESTGRKGGRSGSAHADLLAFVRLEKP